jgi:predicted site-specific integrase-resolvase
LKKKDLQRQILAATKSPEKIGTELATSIEVALKKEKKWKMEITTNLFIFSIRSKKQQQEKKLREKKQKQARTTMGALIQSLRQQDKEPDSDSFGRG